MAVMRKFRDKTFTNKEYKILSVILKPEIVRVLYNFKLYNKEVFTDDHVQVLKELIYQKALLTFAIEKLSLFIHHGTAFANERDLTLKELLTVFGYSYKDLDSLVGEFVKIESEIDFVGKDALCRKLSEIEADLISKGVDSDLIQIIRSVSFIDECASKALNAFVSATQKYSLSPSELYLYCNVDIIFKDPKEFFEEDFIASIKKHKLTLEQAYNLVAYCDSTITNASDLEYLLTNMEKYNQCTEPVYVKLMELCDTMRGAFYNKDQISEQANNEGSRDQLNHQSKVQDEFIENNLELVKPAVEQE